MFKRSSTHFDEMMLAIILWMCTLPLVLLLFPVLGLSITLFAAITLLILIIVICWGVCSWKIFKL